MVMISVEVTQATVNTRQSLAEGSTDSNVLHNKRDHQRRARLYKHEYCWKHRQGLQRLTYLSLVSNQRKVWQVDTDEEAVRWYAPELSSQCTWSLR